MFQLFGNMIPGLSASPVGGIMSGLGSAAQMFSGALSVLGVGAADTRPRAAAISAQSTARKAATSGAQSKVATSAAGAPAPSPAPASAASASAAEPCDFHSLSACLNGCVSPDLSGSVDSACVVGCWDYPCAVAAGPGAAPTDPKALVRGLKLFSIFQQLAARTPLVDAAAVGQIPQAGARRLLQFGPPPIGGGGGAAPSFPSGTAPTGFGTSAATTVAQGLQSFLNGLMGGSSTATAAPTASATQPSSSATTGRRVVCDSTRTVDNGSTAAGGSASDHALLALTRATLDPPADLDFQ